jgi:Transposase DDE domain
LTDGQGIPLPLSVVITAANMYDMKAALNTLDNIVVKRPSSRMYKMEQNLYLDKGYDFQEIEDGVIKEGYYPHIRQSGEQSITKDGDHPTRSRRWLVERTNSWDNRLRKPLVRYEKKIKRLFCVSMFGLLYCYLQEDNFGIGSAHLSTSLKKR